MAGREDLIDVHNETLAMLARAGQLVDTIRHELNLPPLKVADVAEQARVTEVNQRVRDPRQREPSRVRTVDAQQRIA
jgi:hypothetical protein